MRLFISALACLISVSVFGQGACNNQTSITYQGYEYDIVEIGDQCWFAENLRATQYRNGESIVEIDETSTWQNQIYGVYGFCEEIYGAHYNWHAVTNPNGLCPSGWTVPSKYQWYEIFELVDQSVAGAHLKDEILWNGVDTYGFSALPAGTHYTSSCANIGTECRFWTSTAANTYDAWNMSVSEDNSLPSYANQKYYGWSVRCMNTNYFPLSGCTDPTASNYDPDATEDDGSCEYPAGACNNQTSITYQGYEYDIVEIGEQCWFAENCRYLPSVSPSSEGSETEPYYYVYDYEGTDVEEAISTDNYETYGTLYNYPAMISENACPTGWKIPDMGDLDILVNLYSGYENGAYSLQSTETWVGNNNPNNVSGFSGLAGGYYNDFSFLAQGQYGLWWLDNDDPQYFDFSSYDGSVDIYLASDHTDFNSSRGCSIRCIREHTLLEGCTDEESCNYSPDATDDDGSCLYIDECGECGGEGILSGECDCDGNTLDALGVCGGGCWGDFNSNGICDNEDIFGCTYEDANNYNAEATADDGSCIYNEVCVGDLFEDGYITIQDLMILLAVYGTTCE